MALVHDPQPDQQQRGRRVLDHERDADVDPRDRREVARVHERDPGDPEPRQLPHVAPWRSSGGRGRAARGRPAAARTTPPSAAARAARRTSRRRADSAPATRSAPSRRPTGRPGDTRDEGSAPAHCGEPLLEPNGWGTSSACSKPIPRWPNSCPPEQRAQARQATGAATLAYPGGQLAGSRSTSSRSAAATACCCWTGSCCGARASRAATPPSCSARATCCGPGSTSTARTRRSTSNGRGAWSRPRAARCWTRAGRRARRPGRSSAWSSRRARSGARCGS